MIQFDLNRFANLAKWSLTMDRRWFLKNTLAWTVMLTLIFLFFTCLTRFNNQSASLQSYQSCTFMVVAMSLALFVLGSTMMFNSMKGKHDDQRLMLLPASNLEKYLMRYSNWLLLFPCLLASFVVADFLQLLVNAILGHEGRMLVMQYLANGVIDFHWQDDVPRSLGVNIGLMFVWLRSFYAVGTTFFRSHKYNWVMTSIVLIAGGIFAGTLWPNGYFALHFDEHTAISLLYVWNGIFVLLIAFNFWLSYRFFCRQQVIGRFVNL